MMREEDGKDLSLWKTLMRRKDHKNFLFYIVIFALCTLVQLFYGIWVNSIVLISNAFLSVFGCIGLCINLISMVLSRRPPSSKYTYGYDRIETLGVFSNGSMLVFVSLFIFFESIERFLHDETKHVEVVEHHPLIDDNENHQFYHINGTIGTALLGLFVNIFGFIVFEKNFHMRSESRTLEKHKLSEAMMKLMITHIFCTAGVVVSSWYSRGFPKIDAIVAIFIGVIILFNAWPQCINSGRILLQATPLSIKNEIERALKEVLTIDGVLETHDEHFWTQSSGVFVGSLLVRISREADEHRILHIVSPMFPMITHLTVQIEKDDWVFSDC